MRSPSNGPSVLRKFDMYRRVPADLLESSGVQASVCSLVTVAVMTLLFLAELSAFLTPSLQSSVQIHSDAPTPDLPNPGSLDHKLHLQFKITMTDMPCDYVELDLMDALGTNEMDLKTNVVKNSITATGKKEYFGRNVNQRDVLHDHDEKGESMHGTLEELHEDGEHALPVDGGGLAKKFEEVDFVFADFYAPWCVWCQRLAPTWERLAEEVEGMQKGDAGDQRLEDVAVVKVDCVRNADFCARQGIVAFPTLRMFANGEKHNADYKGDRTLEALKNVVYQTFEDFGKKLNEPAKKKAYGALKDKLPGGKDAKKTPIWVAEDHPGCELHGGVWINRVPGRIQIEARSDFHNINPAVTNTSHYVDEFFFGTTSLRPNDKRKIARLPEGYTEVNPLQGNAYKVEHLHEAHHHHLSVVPTRLMGHDSGQFSGLGLGFFSRIGQSILRAAIGSRLYKYVGNTEASDITYYQMSYQTQKVQYDDEAVPIITFAYDINPIMVIVSKETRTWGGFVVKMLALLGGTFTFFGLTEKGVTAVSKKMD